MPPAFHVEAHGNVDLTGYYAQATAYELRGDTMQWVSNRPISQTMVAYPTKPAPSIKDYLKVDQVFPDEYRYNYLVAPVKEGYYLAAVEATDELGNPVPVGMVRTSDGLMMAERPTGLPWDVRVTSYLAPATGAGIIRPYQPLMVSGPDSPADNKSLQPPVPAEQLSDLMEFHGVRYDARPEKLLQAVNGADAGSYADRVLLGPERYANCMVAVNLGALNQVLYDPEQHTAQVSGFHIGEDTGKQGEEFVVDAHAWLAQSQDDPQASTIVDETPPLPAGLSRKDVGLNDTSQEELARQWQKRQATFVPEHERPKPSEPLSFPWQPLAAVGALATLGAAVNRRQWLQLQGGRALDTLRTALPLTEVTPSVFRNLVAEGTYSDPDGQKPIEGSPQALANMRRRVFGYQGIDNDDSLPEDALQRIIDGDDSFMKLLLNAPERRAARNHARRILRARRHQAHKAHRQAQKAAKKAKRQDLPDSTEEIN